MVKILFVPTLHPYKGQKAIEIENLSDMFKIMTSMYGFESDYYIYDFTDHGPVEKLGWTESYYIKLDSRRINVPYTLTNDADRFREHMSERRSGMYTYIRE